MDAIKSFTDSLKSYINKYPRTSGFMGFSLLFSGIFLILYWRFPESFNYPNFYGEDGSVYLQNIIDKGPLKSVVTPFNGYLIIGLYFVELIGMLINALLFGGHFVHMAQSFALASYGCFALAACLPYLLLRKYWGRTTTVGLALAASLVPLPNTLHLIIGTIGNLKWIFLYIAVVLAIYRLYAFKQIGRKIIVVDAFLLLCGYTNVTSYLACILIAFGYIPLLKQIVWSKSASLKKRFQPLYTIDVLSFVGLGLLLFAQLVYIKIHGIPKISGYLDTPFDTKATVEIFFARTVIFDFVHPFYRNLSDGFALALTIIYVGACTYFIKGRERLVALFSIGAALVATAAFVANRPGLSDEVHHYATSGPDQFFYGQNIVIYLSFVLLVQGFARRFVPLRYSRTFVILVLGLLIGSNYASSAHFRHNNLMESYTMTYAQNAIVACQHVGPTVSTEDYPIAGAGFILKVNRAKICDNYLHAHYSISRDNLHIQPSTNFFLVGSQPVFYQTFKASRNNLAGIELFISTFGQKRLQSTYELVLYDVTCTHEIHTSQIGYEVFDNSYYRVHFPNIEHSQGRPYCFSVRAKSVGTLNLALRTSDSDKYTAGKLTLEHKQPASDVVFNLIYSEN